MGTHAPRPLAIGIVAVTSSMGPQERTAARVAVALRANEEGYAPLETFEVDGDPVRDAATYRAIEDLARRMDADALVTSDQVDVSRVEQIAADIRMMVLRG